jgi:hypothetical protein
MRHSVRALLFDLDNTLADRDRAFEGWARWFSRECLGFSEAETIDEVVSVLLTLDGNGYTHRNDFFRAVKAFHPSLADDLGDLTHSFRRQLGEHLPPVDAKAAELLAALDQAQMGWHCHEWFVPQPALQDSPPRA